MTRPHIRILARHLLTCPNDTQKEVFLVLTRERFGSRVAEQVCRDADRRIVKGAASQEQP